MPQMLPNNLAATDNITITSSNPAHRQTTCLQALLLL
jgi:hypothetical protein